MLFANATESMPLRYIVKCRFDMKSPHKKSCELNFFWRVFVFNSSLMVFSLFSGDHISHERGWRWKTTQNCCDTRNKLTNINHFSRSTLHRESFRLAYEINCSFVNNNWATVYCDFSQPVRRLCCVCLGMFSDKFFSFFSLTKRTIALRCDILPLLFVYNRNLLKWTAQLGSKSSEAKMSLLLFNFRRLLAGSPDKHKNKSKECFVDGTRENPVTTKINYVTNRKKYSIYESWRCWQNWIKQQKFNDVKTFVNLFLRFRQKIRCALSKIQLTRNAFAVCWLMIVLVSLFRNRIERDQKTTVRNSFSASNNRAPVFYQPLRLLFKMIKVDKEKKFNDEILERVLLESTEVFVSQIVLINILNTIRLTSLIMQFHENVNSIDLWLIFHSFHR